MIRTIIIDDEPDARRALHRLLGQYCPEVEVIGLYGEPADGLEAIKLQSPDIVFLDVQMPHMNGFELLERLPDIPFAVIFTTAYDSYAIKAIKFSALDYLLKPIDPDDLVSAVQKLEKRPDEIPGLPQYQHLIAQNRQPDLPFQKLAISTQEGMEFISVDNLIHCQADGSYTRLFVLGQKEILVSKTLKEFEQLLSDQGFCRVHHSSLINLRHIQKYIRGEGGVVLLTEGYEVNVSRRRKDEFLQKLTIL